jgi:hypothetical protein
MLNIFVVMFFSTCFFVIGYATANIISLYVKGSFMKWFEKGHNAEYLTLGLVCILLIVLIIFKLTIW